MANDICIICKATEKKKPFLKSFSQRCGKQERMWQGNNTSRDHLFRTLEEIWKTDRPDYEYYHSRCFSCFCTIKILSANIEELSQQYCMATHSSCDHNKGGILGNTFSGKQRRRRLQKWEPLKQCVTINEGKYIFSAANQKCAVRILELGKGLIGKRQNFTTLISAIM